MKYLLLFVLWCFTALAPAQPQPGAPLQGSSLVLQDAQAVRGQATDEAPPADGWQSVTLPDIWASRWPEHNGVVWYRLSWEQADATQPTGLLMNYLVMAGAVYVNGSLIGRDVQLTEPLTRAWNTPRYWLLAPPVLRSGTNTVWVRVHGAASHQAGLGALTVGPAAVMADRYQGTRMWRHDAQLLGLGICATIVFFFGALWWMRRQDTVYGWMALTQAFWLVVGSNHIVTTPWPFGSNSAWQAFNSAALLAYACCFVVFSWRFWRQRHPRLEKMLGALVIVTWAALALTPLSQLENLRALVALVSTLLSWSGCLLFVFKGLASRQTDERWLSLCMGSVVAFGAHDLLVFLKVVSSNMYYSNLAATLLALGMGLVLAFRFVSSLRHIEGFNLVLQTRVDAAKAELASTLQRQHQLEVVNARLSERVELARDLHDGLGGMLVGNIAALEQDPGKASTPQLLGVLKDLRDDLRLILETTGSQETGQHSLTDMLAPLRRRFSHLLEAGGMQCHWQTSQLQAVYLRTSQALDFLRLLQEALTNVLKHSRAKHVQITVLRDEQGLQLVVQDDGVGLAVGEGQTDKNGGGQGLASMQARAKRLGAVLQIETAPGRTCLSMHMPLASRL